ncbi:hypothetical protein HD553DRAFT_362096 [Filobasidium floriforme]|uniref:uncharacterized protein n=1 Tax=Filobasidium floriforme TaxID=5210 RepID=UPI001E8DDC7F|nr:uncharacterized protein HD553DRAFT_362096 [Filobasidium floriforme]KAH8080117.1 hypothetical protein HD553DRAFT_362096 [Filobasidium floriforme]
MLWYQSSTCTTHTSYFELSSMSDYSHGGHQYNHRPPQKPTYHDTTVWTAPEHRYDFGWTASLNVTAYQPDGQLWPSNLDGGQSMSFDSWQQMYWYHMHWQPTSWQQASLQQQLSWLQTVGDQSLVVYNDTVEAGRTQSSDSRSHPLHDDEIPQSRIVPSTPVPAISDPSQSNMVTSRPCRALWKDVDTRTKKRLKTWYKEMEITEGDEHDMQIWGDIQCVIGKGETSGHVVCKKNELKIHYRRCNRSKGWKNHYCTAIHIHLSTRHDQEVNWDTVAKCYRCQVRNNMSKIRRRIRDAKRRKNEIEKSGKGNIE